MKNSNTHIQSFVRNIFEENYAAAREDLRAATAEKLKERVRAEVASQEKKQCK